MLLLYTFLLLLGLFAHCESFNRSLSSTSESVVEHCLHVYNPTVNKVPPREELKKKWAIVCLARPGKMSDIAKRNKHIKEAISPYARNHDITLLFFSEKVFPSSALESWRTTFLNIANVQFICTKDRGYISAQEKYGYKYMCKFFAIDMYDYLQAGGYDYYMRCDTDCYLNPTLRYDILAWAESRNVGYGFAMRKLEAHKPTAETLPKWCAEYMQECNIAQASTAIAMKETPLQLCFNFYNNWHIGKVAFFLRPDVQHFLRAANNSGGILQHRWGDSTIQAYAVRIFMDPRDIVQVPNFTYIHGSHGDRIVSTFGDGSQTNVPQRLPNWVFLGSRT